MTSLSVWVDESEKGDFLVVAGVFVPWTKVPSIVKDWRDMKVALGLQPEAEVKWNLPSNHSTRQALKRAGRTTKNLLEKATEFIARRDDVTCIAITMFEQRNISVWKRWLWSKASVRDFYCEGLKYLLQRVAEEVVETRLQDCVVVCDRPELGRERFNFGTLRRGLGAVEKAYQEWYHQGLGTGPGKQHHRGPLGEIGFHPSILIGDATYHDMLQIADVVAGVTREWVDAVRSNHIPSWEVDRFKVVSVRFRSRHGNPGFFGDGFVLWPWRNELWEALQRSLR